jgi:dolichol kinase
MYSTLKGRVRVMNTLKKRSDLHLARKVWHTCGVLFIAYLHIVIPRNMALLLLTSVSFLTITTDLVRINSVKFNSMVMHVFQPIMRDNEVNRLSGNTFLIIGVLFIELFFSKDIVLLTLFFLAFADPCASYFGIKYGKQKIIGSKSLEGFIAAVIICFVITFLFLTAKNGNIDILKQKLNLVNILFLSLASALVGAFSELIPIAKLDDNLTLPMLSATGLYIIFTVLGNI